jgi:nucleoside-diphosphate kinase
MAMERTLSIIKPDAVQDNVIGKIEAQIEDVGLSIVAVKMTRLSKKQAGEFYSVHKGKDFYDYLIQFMTSGPAIVQVLEGEDAIKKYRKVMGATMFGEAEPGTIRANFATSNAHNAVHGSDSVENAQREIGFFFPERQIYSRKKKSVKKKLETVA